MPRMNVFRCIVLAFVNELENSILFVLFNGVLLDTAF